MLVVCVVYFFAHLIVSPSQHTPDQSEFITLSKSGVVTPRDPLGLSWFIGAQQVKQTLEHATKNNVEIVNLQNEIADEIQQLRERGGGSYLQRLSDAKARIDDGDFAEAKLILRNVERGFSLDTYNSIGAKLFSDVNDHISRLDALKRDQQLAVSNLTPPASSRVFWTNPVGSLFEVLFWSFFGVVTYLLVNSAEYLRTGQFKPSERWVAYTKLVYGPILSLVLVLAIMYGYFDLGGYEVRVYTLPLVAFLFGYAARNIVTLLDKLLERVLGEAGKSIEAGPEAAMARRQAEIAQMMASDSPDSLRNLAVKAKEIAGKVISASVIGKEAKT